MNRIRRERNHCHVRSGFCKVQVTMLMCEVRAVFVRHGTRLKYERTCPCCCMSSRSQDCKSFIGTRKTFGTPTLACFVRAVNTVVKRSTGRETWIRRPNILSKRNRRFSGRGVSKTRRDRLSIHVSSECPAQPGHELCETRLS